MEPEKSFRLRDLSWFLIRNVGVVSHGTAVNLCKKTGILSGRIPDDFATFTLWENANHRALGDQPGAVGPSPSEPFQNGVLRALVRAAPD